MPTSSFNQLKEKLEILEYEGPKEIDKKECVPFSGSPRKHPYEQSRVILIADPFSDQTFFYEFNLQDIALAEQLPSISNLKGESVSMVRVWVKKRSIGLQCSPFIVDSLVRE